VKQEHTLHDLTLREKFILIPLVASIIWLGLFPQSVLNISKPTIQPLVIEAAKSGQVEISASIFEKGGNHE
jgi:NADH:ubiquinone oxidoreductase subunit 4 (subunit M)